MKLQFRKVRNKDGHRLIVDGVILKDPFIWKCNEYDDGYACILDIWDTSQANISTMKYFSNLNEAKRCLIEQYTEKHFTKTNFSDIIK